MNTQWSNLLRVLRQPEAMLSLEPVAWDVLLRQALSAGLLARLDALAQRQTLTERLPAFVQRRFRAARVVAEQQRRAVLWELVCLGEDLAELAGPVVLLKGAAYVACNSPAAAGRTFSDIDLLVPRGQLDQAEAALMLRGWASGAGTTYDQRYYRTWMHELPPMVHLRRQTNLDLHHNLLPLTARIKTPAEPVLQAAVALPEHPGFHVPSPLDQILHSATHLMHEGEWGHGLRDLVDLDALIRDQQTQPGFWPALTARAATLSLGRPLYYALRLCRRWLQTPVPDTALAGCPQRPSALLGSIMEGVFSRALSRAHTGFASSGAAACEFLLYVRSHYLRMPLHLLLPHLLHKALQRPPAVPRESDDTGGNDLKRAG
jgi:hypothetical protein